MTVLKTLWASIQGDPQFMRRVNGWFTIFWIAMIPLSVLTGWVHSVTYISALSLWALVSGHWSAWQAARVEVEQQREAMAAAAHPPEERVVERLVETTNIELLDPADKPAPAPARPRRATTTKTTTTTRTKSNGLAGTRSTTASTTTDDPPVERPTDPPNRKARS